MNMKLSVSGEYRSIIPGEDDAQPLRHSFMVTDRWREHRFPLARTAGNGSRALVAITFCARPGRDKRHLALDYIALQ